MPQDADTNFIMVLAGLMWIAVAVTGSWACDLKRDKLLVWCIWSLVSVIGLLSALPKS